MLPVLAVPAGAAVHTLNPGDSILQNITGASGGDTIILNPGIYDQYGISISKNITIMANISAGGSAADTAIDARNDGGIFTVGPGLSFAIDNLTIMNGTATTGGAINATRAEITVTSSVFRNCSASSAGGAIASTGGSTLTVDRSVFSGCQIRNYVQEAYGGVISSVNDTAIAICSSSFNETFAIRGGAIYADNVSVTVDSSDFSPPARTGITGGGIYCRSGNLTGSVFHDIATITAPAVYDAGSDDNTDYPLRITSSFFENSRGFEGAGPVTSNVTTTITSSHFSHLVASMGGAIYVCMHPLNVTSSTFHDCGAARYVVPSFCTPRLE